MIGTLIALGCLFAAVALILGLIFMPRTVAMLFGIHIAIPYLGQLAVMLGKDYSPVMAIITLVILVIALALIDLPLEEVLVLSRV
ncbi:unnamed protein product [marine sediment metagenome]|uniref:Uncharacterized protein n=1 Tax=marine sediment metagenome TaxID=412755 RepID=X0YG67_9ZZZZ